MCPHCGKYSLCSCQACAGRRESGESETPKGLLVQILIDPIVGLLECPYCNKQYMYYEAEDASWKAYTKTEQYKQSIKQ